MLCSYADHFQVTPAERAFQGNLPDQQKVLIFDPHHDYLRDLVAERIAEYSTSQDLTLWVGTYNLCGRPPGSESLLPFFFPDPSIEPELLVLGFQEIVELSPQQIMATDPEKKHAIPNRRRWEQFIMQNLAEREEHKSSYFILRSEQLVGTALIILVKSSVAHDIRNVEATTKKTGFKGVTGNKGAVAIRLDFRDTSFCFITAHFAAGHSAVEERNRDYFTISSELKFQRGRRIDTHDNVIWLGDFNYRISLQNEEVRMLAEADDYDSLLQGDQLRLSMATRNVFAGYAEAPITFRPTYKYDQGTEVYDTSEKQRIPAWTDRIFYRGRELDIWKYTTAKLYQSDHRPVYGQFRASVRTIDVQKKAALIAKLQQDQSVILAAKAQGIEDSYDNLEDFKDLAVFDGTLPTPRGHDLDSHS
ncbi:DNase I-like protein [Atractiella rhizophila]|nr:DNase I-like protein [Atractiella rhizophila]